MEHPKCKSPACDKPARHMNSKHGLCEQHYRRLLKGQETITPIRVHRTQHGPACTAEGCYRPYHAGGLCKACYDVAQKKERKKDPAYLEAKRAQNREYMRRKRENLEFLEAERALNREYKRRKRADPAYRESERARKNRDMWRKRARKKAEQQCSE